MARHLHIGALLAGLIGGLALPAGSAGETPADPLTRAHAAMPTVIAQAASAGRGARDLACAPVQGMATDHSGATSASVPVPGNGAAAIADYVAMHRHATQAQPFTWQPVQACTVR